MRLKNLLQPLKEILYVTILIGTAYCYYNIGYSVALHGVSSAEQNDFCRSTKQVEAWIARKDGEVRCFLESRKYPHRVRAANLDGDTEDLPASGG